MSPELPGLLLLVCAPVVAVLIFRDAYRLGMQQKLWGALALLFPLTGWILYLVARLVFCRQYPFVNLTGRELPPPPATPLSVFAGRAREVAQAAPNVLRRGVGRVRALPVPASRSLPEQRPDPMEAGRRVLELPGRTGRRSTRSGSGWSGGRLATVVTVLVVSLVLVGGVLWFAFYRASDAGVVQAGVIAVEGLAGAEVYLDGTLRGEVPLRISGVSPGAHSLIVRKDGYDTYTKSVNVREGATVQVAADLRGGR